MDGHGNQDLQQERMLQKVMVKLNPHFRSVEIRGFFAQIKVCLGYDSENMYFRLVFGVGRFRSVEVDFWRPTLRSILDRPTKNDRDRPY